MSDSHSHLPAASSAGHTAGAASADPHAHSSAHDHGHHDMHLKLYIGIGIALILLTGFTVFLSYVDFGSQARNMVVGMIVATFKVSLVMAIFMHLKGERPTIWRFLYFTAFFVLGLFLLTLLHWVDPIFGTSLNVH